MSRSVRAGVLGLGVMGRNHARVLEALDGVELVAIADPAVDPGRMAGTKIVHDLEQLLACGIEMCVVAVPTEEHLRVGLALAEAGVHAPVLFGRSVERVAPKRSRIGRGRGLRCRPVSTEVSAIMHRPVRLAELSKTAAAVLAELVGVDAVLSIRFSAGTVRKLGQVVQAGTEVSEQEAALIYIGPSMPDRGLEVVQPSGDTLVVLDSSPAVGDWRLVCEPRRDAVGIVTALAVALAAALGGDGQIVDLDLRLAPESNGDPAAFVAATRLDPSPRSLGEACLAYLRQFPDLEGWPPA